MQKNSDIEEEFTEEALKKDDDGYLSDDLIDELLS